MEQGLTERLSNLGEQLKAYADTRIELARYTFIDKLSAGIALILSNALMLLSMLFVVFFSSCAAAFYIGQVSGSLVAGFLWVAGAYLFIFLLVLIFRRPLIHNPVSNKLIRELLEEKDNGKD